MKMKKFLAVCLSALTVTGMLAGCGGAKGGDTSSAGAEKEGSSAEGSVYYLNFKPEIADQWEEIAAKYTEETGIPVKVKTAASNQYEQTLKSEMAKSDAPTLFQINGPVGYQSWKEYCADLKDTEFYNMLVDKDLAITEGDGVYGIPFAEEGYGIIYNKEIMDKYFALPGAKATSMDDIKNFDTLKAVVEDMTAHKADLGIDGVFASTSFAPGEDWRWQTHLMNLPIYYEYKDADVKDEDEISFKYNENFKNIFDLYLNNSTVEPTMVGSKTVDDSMAEFALGKAAMVQNGNWAWSQISKVSGNVVKEENVKFMPIYTGVEGEETQGLCIGTENYMCVNSNASEADQKASLDFLKWVFSSDEGKEMVTNDLQFITPFSTFGDDEISSDPLAQEVVRYMKMIPLQRYRGTLQHSQARHSKMIMAHLFLSMQTVTKKWDAVVSDTVAEWASEKEATAE
ncbi:MAG: ABC transporter substrate-binding protein [Eubacterium sp.]